MKEFAFVMCLVFVGIALAYFIKDMYA